MGHRVAEQKVEVVCLAVRLLALSLLDFGRNRGVRALKATGGLSGIIVLGLA